jgi:hypothetical protein
MGVAPNAEIVPIRIASDIETVPDTVIADTIRQGADQAGQRGVENLSFAVPAVFPRSATRSRTPCPRTWSWSRATRTSPIRA